LEKISSYDNHYIYNLQGSHFDNEHNSKREMYLISLNITLNLPFENSENAIFNIGNRVHALQIEIVREPDIHFP